VSGALFRGSTARAAERAGASTDPDTLASWWRRWPWANIGIATGARSGIIVVDVDRPAGEGCR
jgi:hypothetical protein